MRVGRPRKIQLKKSVRRKRYKSGIRNPKQRAAIRARNRVRRRRR